MAIEERSFVAKGAPLDDGQGRFGSWTWREKKRGELGAGRKDGWGARGRKDKMALYS
jgi:hypothetical protein